MTKETSEHIAGESPQDLPEVLQPSDEQSVLEKEPIERSLETKIQTDPGRRDFWVSSPLVISVFSALFGILGAGLGATLQGRSNLQLERQKFEASLIQKALDTKDRNEAAKSLLFLVDCGVIQSLDGDKIRRIAAESPDQLPLKTQMLMAAAGGGAIALSPLGDTFLVGDRDATVKLFSLVTAKLERTFLGHEDSVTSVAYFPNATLFASGSLDRTVRIWDVVSGRVTTVLRLDSGVIGLGLSPDGTRLLVRTESDEISEWDSITGTKLANFRLGTAKPP